MNKHRFVFLVKKETVVPQSLDEADAGEIIRTLLLQNFSVSDLHIMAESNRVALENFKRMNKLYTRAKEVVIC